MARQEVVKDVSDQVIWFYPQEGRPSAKPTVTIKNKFGSTVLADANTYVTQGTANTTTDGATTKKAIQITLDAVTGITVGRTYLLTGSLGQFEWVRVYSVDSSSKVVVLDEPLEHAYADEATFVDTAFYYTLQDTEVDTLYDMYRARATYTVDSMVYTQEINFDVVLTPLINPLTVEYIKKRYPDIMNRQHSQQLGSDFADFRAIAWDNVLKGIRAHKTGWRPALLKTPEGVESWALTEFDLLAHKSGVKILRDQWDPQQAIEHLEGQIYKERSFALNTLEFMDFDDNDAPSADEIQPRRPSFRR